jgi:hypothetical protein
LQSTLSGGRNLLQSGMNAGRSFLGFGEGNLQPGFAGGNSGGLEPFQPKVYPLKGSKTKAQTGSTPITAGKPSHAPEVKPVAGNSTTHPQSKAPKVPEEVVPSPSKGKTSSRDKTISQKRQKLQKSSNTESGGGNETIATAPSFKKQPNLPLSREDLSPRIRSIHDRLPKSGSVMTFRKKDVSLRQLAQLGRMTGDEYSVFTLGGRRTVIRGYGNEVSVSPEMYDKIMTGKLGRWSGHTHPPEYGIEPGPGDRPFLQSTGMKRNGIWGIDEAGNTHTRPFGEMPSDDTLIESELARQKWRKLYGQ